MALDVKIQNIGGSYFRLKASDWQFSYSRTVTSVPLPGGTVFQMDLQMVQPSVKVSGTCDKDGTGGANGIAHRRDFDTIINTWCADDIYLYENATTSYLGKIRSFNMRREPAQDYFTWDLEFLINPSP